MDTRQMASEIAKLVRRADGEYSGEGGGTVSDAPPASDGKPLLWKFVRSCMDDVSYGRVKELVKTEPEGSEYAVDVWATFGEMWEEVDKLATERLYAEEAEFSPKFGPLYIYSDTPGRTPSDVAELFEIVAGEGGPGQGTGDLRQLSGFDEAVEEGRKIADTMRRIEGLDR